MLFKLAVVAEHRLNPTEGFRVVAGALTEGLRRAGHRIDLVEPKQLRGAMARWLVNPPDAVIFAHGPGRGTVVASALIRRLMKTKVIWIATRPDLAGLPSWLQSRRTAHGVICNRVRDDLQSVAIDAEFVQQYIGIAPARVAAGGDSAHPWPDLAAEGRLVVLHVGHLRSNRGLEVLARAKRELPDKIDVVVQSSPTFEPDPEVVDDLRSSGVLIRHGYQADLGSLYRSADLYAFPTRPGSGGAIDLPLGVLEALASGTPVLSTPFGALEAALSETRGVIFARQEKFVDVLRRLTDGSERLQRPYSFPERLDVARTVEASQSLLEALCGKS